MAVRCREFPSPKAPNRVSEGPGFRCDGEQLWVRNCVSPKSARRSRGWTRSSIGCWNPGPGSSPPLHSVTASTCRFWWRSPGRGAPRHAYVDLPKIVLPLKPDSRSQAWWSGSEASGSSSWREAVSVNCVLGCLVVAGGRLSAGNAHGSCWGERRFCWSEARRRWSVGSIAKASKVRILHSPPRAQRASFLHGWPAETPVRGPFVVFGCDRVKAAVCSFSWGTTSSPPTSLSMLS